MLSIVFIGRVYKKMRGRDLTERVRQEAFDQGARMAHEEIKRNAQEEARNIGL